MVGRNHSRRTVSGQAKCPTFRGTRQRKLGMRTPLLKGKVRRNTVRIYENSSVKIDSSLHVDTTRRLSYRLFRECCSRCSHTKNLNVSNNFKTRFLCSLQSGNLWTTTTRTCVLKMHTSAHLSTQAYFRFME